MRLQGPSEAVWEAYPEGALGAAEAVTELGGPEGVILVLAVAYWLLDRERTARVAAIAVAGVGFMFALKYLFALPRPPEPVLPTDTYGFPSGHAFTAVVVYGGLVYGFERHRDWRYAGLAGLLVVAIALSRVVLRLHYLGDVVVGALLGGVFLVAMDHFLDRVDATDTPRLDALDRADPTLVVGFALGLVFATAAVLLSGFEENTVAVLGIAVGTFAASFRLEAVPPLRSRAEAIVLVACGVGYLVAVIAVLEVLVGTPTGVVQTAASVLLHAVLIAGVFLGPVVVRRVVDWRPPLDG